jgi:hypothetical protein
MTSTSLLSLRRTGPARPASLDVYAYAFTYFARHGPDG